MVRQTPRRSHQSNGAVERYHASLQGQLRAMRIALQDHLEHEIPLQHPVTTWLVRHSAWALQRFQPYLRGGTPYQRLHGTPYRSEVCEFGERVLAFNPDADRSAPSRIPKFAPRWVPGVWLGRSDSSNEHLVAVGGRVAGYRAVQRATEARWDSDSIMGLRCTPWDARGERPSADSSAPAPPPPFPPAAAVSAWTPLAWRTLRPTAWLTVSCW